jgi:cytochrome c biogenesis protein CcmG/thiol:disulfide interchange protein DsbE
MAPAMKGFIRFVPIALFLALVGALVWRLVHPGNSEIRSQLADRPVPAFTLPAAAPGKPGLATNDLATGKPHLLNLFASWCVPCITEIPLLKQLSVEGVPIVGIDIRDRPDALASFLERNGDPFTAIGADSDSAAQIALGSSGVPETFIIDGRGIVRHQYIGGLTASDLPQVRAALAEAAR